MNVQSPVDALSTETRKIIVAREEVIDALKDILVEHLGLRMGREMIELDVPLFASGLGLDSVDALELVVAIEERFQARIPQDVVRAALRTLNTLTDFLVAMRASNQPLESAT